MHLSKVGGRIDTSIESVVYEEAFNYHYAGLLWFG